MSGSRTCWGNIYFVPLRAGDAFAEELLEALEVLDERGEISRGGKARREPGPGGGGVDFSWEFCCFSGMSPRSPRLSCGVVFQFFIASQPSTLPKLLHQ